jgi:Mediator complex protein
MEPSKDVPMDDANADVDSQHIHEPFTVEENIQQLNAIDKMVVQLIHHTGAALDALAAPPSTSLGTASSTALPGTGSSNPGGLLVGPAARKEAFNTATDAFLDALHFVDVRMKRQIMGLEEAGIVSLTPASSSKDPNSAVAKGVSLKPNGMGAVGNLDVGWLNSRGNRVEKDMEAEIWGKTRELLEKEGSRESQAD